MQTCQFLVESRVLLEILYTCVEHLSLDNRPNAFLFRSSVVIYQATEYTYIKRNMLVFGTLPSIKSLKDHASVTLPGVLQNNVGHSNFRYVSLKKNHII